MLPRQRSKFPKRSEQDEYEYHNRGLQGRRFQLTQGQAWKHIIGNFSEEKRTLEDLADILQKLFKAQE